MKKKVIREYKDIFKLFPMAVLEKTEIVLSALQDHDKTNSILGAYGIPIDELKCTKGDIKIAIPVLEDIRNIIFPPNKTTLDDKENVGLLKIHGPNERVTITKDNKITGLFFNDIVNVSLKEIRLYLSKNKITKKSRKIYLILSNVGLKNEQNGEVYPISGNRLKYIEMLIASSPLTAKQIIKETKQDEKIVFRGIPEINRLAREYLFIEEELISNRGNGYFINPSYDIKNLKK